MTWANNTFPPTGRCMTFASRPRDMTVTSPRMAQKNCIRSVFIEGAPRFVRDGHVTKRATTFKRKWAIFGEGVELTVAHWLILRPTTRDGIRRGVMTVWSVHGFPFSVERL
jgi:hypothetical protein